MHKLLLTITMLLSPLLLAAETVFVHCFDFGCKSQKDIKYGETQWREIKAIFDTQPLDATGEKQAIRKAVGLMEHFSGEIVGTSLDKAGNYPGYDLEKQQDCIDESTNTYQYLKAIEELDLLKWHKVAPKKRRIVWFATHWTAVIEEHQSKQLFAVDSWYRDNGEPPYIQKLEDWEDKDDFPVEYNPD
jgi:hypothetical protein